MYLELVVVVFVLIIFQSASHDYNYENYNKLAASTICNLASKDIEDWWFIIFHDIEDWLLFWNIISTL